MKVIDLFAGAGGLSEGFRQSGFEICAHVEIDPNASLTLQVREAYFYLKETNQLDLYKSYLKNEISREKLFESIPKAILERVINVGISDESILSIFEKIDELLNNQEVSIIIGGPPCQAYSIAGRSRDPQRMKNDPRNFLYRQYIKFLVKYRPKFFVFENVLGILSAQNGEIFKNIKSEISDAGYRLDYRVLNSKDFGVSQSRKRVIIIGWRADINFDYPEFISQKPESTIRELFFDLPPIRSGETSCSYLPNRTNVPKFIRNGWDVLSQHVARPQRGLDLEIYRFCVEVWNNEGRKVKYNELPRRLITQNNTNTFLDRFNVVPYDNVSHTIVAHISKDGHYYIHPDINQNRSLSIREAARIQSFPDDYYFESSRTSAFKQIGNAVPPLMAREIARKFLDTGI